MIYFVKKLRLRCRCVAKLLRWIFTGVIFFSNALAFGQVASDEKAAKFVQSPPDYEIEDRIVSEFENKNIHNLKNFLGTAQKKELGDNPQLEALYQKYCEGLNSMGVFVFVNKERSSKYRHLKVPWEDLHGTCIKTILSLGKKKLNIKSLEETCKIKYKNLKNGEKPCPNLPKIELEYTKCMIKPYEDAIRCLGNSNSEFSPIKSHPPSPSSQ